MVDTQLLQLKSLLDIEDGDTSEDVKLLALLSISAQKILNKRYPYNDSVTVVPSKFLTKQVEIAVYLYNKQGAEGQTAHNENGIDRTYERAGVPTSMLEDITPFTGVIEDA